MKPHRRRVQAVLSARSSLSLSTQEVTRAMVPPCVPWSQIRSRPSVRKQLSFETPTVDVVGIKSCPLVSLSGKVPRVWFCCPEQLKGYWSGFRCPWSSLRPSGNSSQPLTSVSALNEVSFFNPTFDPNAPEWCSAGHQAATLAIGRYLCRFCKKRRSLGFVPISAP